MNIEEQNKNITTRKNIEQEEKEKEECRLQRTQEQSFYLQIKLIAIG